MTGSKKEIFQQKLLRRNSANNRKNNQRGAGIRGAYPRRGDRVVSVKLLQTGGEEVNISRRELDRLYRSMKTTECAKHLGIAVSTLMRYVDAAEIERKPRGRKKAVKVGP